MAVEGRNLQYEYLCCRATGNLYDLHNRELRLGSLALETSGVPAKWTLMVKSVDDVWIRSKVTSMEIDVAVTVSRWHGRQGLTWRYNEGD